jgi:lipopolysaccharide biosynthesis glycosyltransferase
MKTTIPICFTFDANYAIGAAVTIYSLLKNASLSYNYKIYIIHSNIPDKDQKVLNGIVDKFPNASLEFKVIDYFNESWGKLKNKAHFSKEIFNKLILSKIFPEYDRILLSDVDVVFVNDFSPAYFLFANEFFYYAGVSSIIEVEHTDLYRKNFTAEELVLKDRGICAGFLLVNLKNIRESRKDTEMLLFYEDNLDRLIMPEQDCIDLCCLPHIKYMPFNYEIYPFFYKLNMSNTKFHADVENAQKQFKDCIENPVMLHYIGPLKPWNSFFTLKSGIWFKYLRQGGIFTYYLKTLPMSIKNRLRRYSVKRFWRKLLLVNKREK